MRLLGECGRLLARGVLGGYLVVHGSQKLFGSFGGYGLDGTGQYMEGLGLTPGKQYAALAGSAELGGGVLTATGILEPLGPIAIAGVMAVATSTHISKGPMAADGGYELPLTNLALASYLALSSPSVLRLGPRLSRTKTALVLLLSAGLVGFIQSKLLAHQSQQLSGATVEDTVSAAP